MDEVRQVLLPSHKSHVPDLVINEDSSLTDLVIKVFDFETPFEHVDLTVNSSNPELLPVANIDIAAGATAEDRLLSLTPTAGLSGVADIELTVSDSHGFELSQVFKVTVLPVNDAPTFTPGAEEVASRNDQSVTIDWASEMSAGPANEAGQNLRFELTIEPGDEALFSELPVIDAATGQLSFTPAPMASSVATITAVLVDDGGTENAGQDSSQPFTFEIGIAPATAQIETIILDVSPNPRIDSVDEIVIVFSQPVTGFDVDSLTLRRNNGENLLNDSVTLESVGDTIWTLGNLSGVSALPGEYSLVFDADSSAVTNLDGTSTAKSAVELWQNVVQAGDANRDGRYDELDMIQVLQAGKYRTGQPATWEEGDWNNDNLFESSISLPRHKPACTVRIPILQQNRVVDAGSGCRGAAR